MDEGETIHDVLAPRADLDEQDGLLTEEPAPTDRRPDSRDVVGSRVAAPLCSPIVLLGGLALFAGCAHPSGRPGSGDAVDGWVGAWATADDVGAVTTEVWLRPHPRLLLGFGTTEARGRRSTEHLAVELREEGPVYVAHPAGQRRVEFLAVEDLSGGLAFENRDHDFPQRLVYRRSGTGPTARLDVRAEGSRDRVLELELLRRPQPSRPPDLVKTRTFSVPPGELYEAFTTEAGVKAFLAPEARVEARPWGAFEPYLFPEAPEGQRGGEGCRFIELARNTRVAFTWRFPPTLPDLRHAMTLVTIEVEPALDDHLGSRLTLRQAGFHSGPEWAKGRAYFDRAWDLVLANLARRFEKGPIDWSDAPLPTRREASWRKGSPANSWATPSRSGAPASKSVGTIDSASVDVVITLCAEAQRPGGGGTGAQARARASAGSVPASVRRGACR